MPRSGNIRPSQQFFTCNYELWPESIQPCNTKNKHLLNKIQDTRNNVHRTVTSQSPSKEVPWDLTQFSQSSSGSPSYFHESQWQSEISSLSKVILILVKAVSSRTPNLDGRGLSHLGALMLHQKTMQETWWMSGCIVVMKLPINQLPTAVAFWMLRIVSVEEWSSVMQNLM